jgi:uncharacterized protein (TIGR03118 family)
MNRLMGKPLAKSIKQWKKTRLPRGKGAATPRTRPYLEVLEARVVPSGSDWSMYNYSISGTRDNTAEHTLSPSSVGGLQVQWSFPTKGVVAGTPAVVGDAVYAGDSTGNFYALTRDGKLLWQTQVNGPVTDSPLVEGNMVIFGTLGNSAQGIAGTIYGLDARTGKVLWQTQPQPNDPRSQIWGSATPVGDDIAIGVASGDEGSPLPPTSRGALVLLDPNNGQIIWQTLTVTDAQFAQGSTGAGIWSTPAYDPATKIIYAPTGNNYSNPTTSTEDAMVAFDAKDGHIIWANSRTNGDNWDGRFNSGAPDFDFGDSAHLYTLPDGEKVVSAGQKSGFYHVFDAATGAVVNQFQVSPGSTLGGLFATAAVDPETGVGFANDRFPHPGQPATGEVAAIAPDASHLLWEFPTPSADQSGVALANGVVYFQDLGGTFYALDEKTGKMLAQLFTGGADSGPAISDGQIFLGQGNILGHGFNSPGGIVALGLSKAEPSSYLQTNLVSDISGEAGLTDPNLKNPWGVSESTKSPFWVSDQGTSFSTLYSVTPAGVSKVPLNVAIPKTAAGPQGPTGQVNNDTSSFPVNGKPAIFIFANLNGTISAWNGGNTATIEATTPGAVYTGLAIGTNATGSFLYAANGAQNRIDVFDGSFTPVKLPAGAFVDPLLPTDLNLVPFNVQNIGGLIYVTYAPAGRAAQVAATEGQGAVAIFDTSGVFQQQLIVGSKLASPWGIALAPAGFGAFGGDLLVGNFAFNVSEINAFNPTTGKFLGTLTDLSGDKILNQALWSLHFGNGASGGDPNTLYFTAGINGEKDGLFGSLQAVPELPPKSAIVPNLGQAATQVVTTVATNGDLNPYGVAFVPQDFQGGGVLAPGDILVSNFNNSSNVQGTGSSIVKIGPNGQQSTFFPGPTGLGLTTALGVLPQGFVLVGSAPATTVNGTNTVGNGGLLILDSFGNQVGELTDSALLQGPWDLTIHNVSATEAQVFVSNVLSGTVTRINFKIPNGGTPQVESETQIASGYAHRTDPNALVVGPTGLAFDAKTGTLYVASTGDNAIYAIKDAAKTDDDQGKGKAVVQDPQHLHGPLGLLLAPNGDLIAANGDAVNQDPNQLNELVEFTPKGKFVGQFQIDGGAAGAAFGLAEQTVGDLTRFAAVDDNTNTLHVFTFDPQPPSDDGGNFMQSNASGSMMQSMTSGMSQDNASMATPTSPPSNVVGNISQIDAFFQAFNSMLKTLEAMESSMAGNNAQIDALFQMLNSTLGSLESGIAGHPISI